MTESKSWTFARTMATPWPRWAKVALVLAALGLAGSLFFHALADYTLADITRAVREIPTSRMLLALGSAAGSYFTLTWFDSMAVRYAGKPLGYTSTALASFTSLSLGHNIGFAALSSGAVRYRFYSRWGLSGEQVAKVVLFCGVTVGLGLMVTGGGALLLRPRLAEQLTGLKTIPILALGLSCLALALGYLLLAWLVRGRLRVWQWSFEMPTLGLAAGQLVAGTVNYIFVSACLYQGMAVGADIPFLAAAAAFVIANTLSLLAHVPGGLGVIESVVLLLLSHAQVVGALVLFRATYYLVPLILGGTILLVTEGLGGVRPGRERPGGTSS